MSEAADKLRPTAPSIPDRRVVYTVGHSTRPLDELIALLQAHKIEILADVRHFPGSRRYPHFNAGSLAVELPRVGIAYHSLVPLGGRRQPTPDSVNTGWRNASFRGYADYMRTPEFLDGLSALIGLAERAPTAIMCAEAVPWRCHRSLIGDALLVRGWRVLDILSPTKATPHELTPFSQVEGELITYPKTSAAP